MSTLLLAEKNRIASQSRKVSLKPYLRSTSKRNDQDSKSKARARSSFRRILGAPS
jgi:hypothetical protein